MIFFTIIIFLSLSVQSICSDYVHVRVKQGILAGEQVMTVTNRTYYSFKGIPYAKPPVGILRFKAPLDPDPWTGVRNATSHGAVCPQVNTVTNEYIPGSEDCLFLNVYTPHLKPHKLLAVIVVIHGGAYLYGSGNNDIYGPDFLVSEEIILVTFNYRLDALGFLSLGTCEVPGNAAMKDQVAALKWVRNNIKNFGGDPNCVTLMGESSGAASVGFHLVSPMSKGLIHRAVLMSGSPLCDWSAAFKPERRTFILGESLGLYTKNKTELLEFLQSVPYHMLINSSTTVMVSEQTTNVIFKMQQFPPVIERKCPENSFLTEDPTVMIQSGNINKVDIMFSYNQLEALYGLVFYERNNYSLINLYKRYPEMLVPSKILLNFNADEILCLADRIHKYFFGNRVISVVNMYEFLKYSSSIGFASCTQKFSRLWPDIGRKYFFKFSSYSSRNQYGPKGERYGIRNTSHFDDIFYIYNGKSSNMPLNMDSIEYKMIQHITKAITNFAKCGNPTPDPSLGVIWPQYNSCSLAYMTFTDKLKVEYALDEEDYQFWDSIYGEAGLPCW